ncbi:hypothetical protein W97_07170 [Coniosporium apollinis CBS 100218]|uniref:Uncharacterized protein n=1 Tax=Coniosporium apollinis (strain CBS 100218) TaxID=1168221 RepID=R7Z1Q2_CONA1|nr:uncharacterized protein W97_07170 [Coniosporium apollinis CBS 100218]EON68023.1 hypothetical protein W97_07170 [Coniosporium apollinis CBS 100218]
MDMKPFNLDRSVASLYTFNLYLRNRETNHNNRTSPAGEVNDRDESGRDRAGPSTTQMEPAEETNETTAENAETTGEPAGLFGGNGVTTDAAESSANTTTASPQAAMVQPSQTPTVPTTNVANNPSANMGVATTAAAPALHLGLAPNNPPADNGSDESDEDTFTLKGLARTLNKLFPEGLTVGMANAMPAVMEAFEGNLDDNNAANANGGNAALTKEERYLKYLCEFIEALSVSKVQAEQKENITLQHLRVANEREARLRAEGEGLRTSLGYWEQSYNAVFAGAGNGNGPTAPQHGESSSAGAAREAALAATQHTAPQPTTTMAPATQPPGNMWPMMLALDRLRRDNMRLYDIVGQLTTRCRALEQRHTLDHPSDADFFASTENWNNTTMATGGFDANTQTQPPFAPVPIDGMDGTNISVMLAMNNPEVMQAAGRAFFREFNYQAAQIANAMMAANLAQQPAPPLPVPGPQPPAPGAAPPSAPMAPTNPAPSPGTQGPAGPSDPAGAL